MNALPVGPQHMADPDSRNRYFDDLERLGFDIAYNAYYAFPYDDVVGKHRQAYVEFAAEAHRRGLPACIQIQSTVCAGDVVSIDEAQYDVDNNPDRWGEKGFFASFASEAWKNYLKDLTTLFVNEYGFDSVVFEEPMYRVDIPGTKDRFHAKFTAQYPDVSYPHAREETSEYLRVQQAKADILIDFYSDLVSHARAVGAVHVGIMPWFFIPTIENTPAGTLNTACEINRIAAIEGLDWLIVRMQPDNIFAGTMRTGDNMQESPALYYIEVMAHLLCKDIIAVSNPTDEHTDYPACPLIPLDFYKDSVHASLAAQPGGFTRHWYGQNYGADEKHNQVLADAASYASRLGEPTAPVAFVFSYSGSRHAEPYTYETVFQFYWALMKRMTFKSHFPMLTFFAETLEDDLARHPEVQALILEEHFPLSPDQMRVISRWWQGDKKRALLAFGSGLGFSANPDSPGLQPCAAAFPGVLELIGLKQEDEARYAAGRPIVLHDVSRVRRSAFLGDNVSLSTDGVANARRVFGARASVLYELDSEEQRIPVIAEWRDRSTIAVFCGFELSEQTSDIAEKAVRYVLRETNAPGNLVGSCTDGILWNVNANGYLVISNVSDTESRALVASGRANLWDCCAKKLLRDGSIEINFAPRSFGVYRVVGRRSKFFDILGISRLRSLIDGAGRAEINVVAGKQTTLVLRASPKEILVDGRPCTIFQEVVNGAYHVTLRECPSGERAIELKW